MATTTAPATENASSQPQSHPKGGNFLLQATPPSAVFTIEELTEEQRLLRNSVNDFIAKEIEPRYKEINSPAAHALSPGLLEKAGELGFLAVGVPEAYGGYDVDFTTQVAFGEKAYSAYHFGLTIGVQTSLGVAPLLFYGNEAQKAKYLPAIVTAQLKSCYCLTEPGAGSDANAGKTRATLNTAGTHYLLNGQKMWITNSGFADLFFVFAKVDDDPNLSCLIVEKTFGGITVGAEEHKMGINGSSTRQVFFNDVPVPVGNLLGTRNKGFKMAVNVLNTGRIKMGASVTSVARKVLKLAIDYSSQRKQFGQPIAAFGAMQHKLGHMAARLYAMESMVYRAAHDIDTVSHQMIAQGKNSLEAKPASIAEFAIECAMIKVYNTEGLDMIVDETLQIHGGMGYSKDTRIEQYYRDSRINRIYEGTNEINRMLAVDMLLRKAMKGQLDLMAAAAEVNQQAQAGTLHHPVEASNASGPYEHAHAALAGFKKAWLLIAGTVAQKLLPNLKDEQEVLMHMADMALQIYAVESATLRSHKHHQPDERLSSLRQQMVVLLSHEAATKLVAAGKEVAYVVAEGQAAESLIQQLQLLTHLPPYNLKNARRTLAQALTEKGQYFFD